MKGYDGNIFQKGRPTKVKSTNTESIVGTIDDSYYVSKPQGYQPPWFMVHPNEAKTKTHTSTLKIVVGNKQNCNAKRNIREEIYLLMRLVRVQLMRDETDVLSCSELRGPAFALI